MFKQHSKLIIIFSIVFAAIALIATVTTALVFLDRRRDEKELERYLEDSIQ